MLEDCHERPFYNKKNLNIYASDEVGRGPLAGPVVAATARFSGNLRLACELLNELKVTDSKKLTAKKRLSILSSLGIDSLVANKELQIDIHPEIDLSIYISEISPREIDEINILQASLLAMRVSCEGLFHVQKGEWWIDGNKGPREIPGLNQETIVKGDSKSYLIGLASIFAKEYRDQLMSKYAEEYPFYGFEKNAGYPTKMHLEGIQVHGITPIHRKSFKGVREFV